MDPRRFERARQRDDGREAPRRIYAVLLSPPYVGWSSKQKAMEIKEGRGKNRHTNQGPRTCAGHVQRSRPGFGDRSVAAATSGTGRQAGPRGPRPPRRLVDARVAAFLRVVPLPARSRTRRRTADGATATAPGGGSDGSGP